MKHVFVETNFLIEVLRPFPERRAMALLARHGRDATIHVPWCSFDEAGRTLKRITESDLAFVDNVGRFLGQQMAGTPRPPPVYQQQVRKLIDDARSARKNALFDYPDRLLALQGRLSVLQPTPGAVAITLQQFAVKTMTPFDEMVFGVVLYEARQLHAQGQRDMYFCNLNKNDFEPNGTNGFGPLYLDAGVTYLSSFDVP